MKKETLKKSITTVVEAVAMSTADKSKRESCCIFFYQPKEPVALRCQTEKDEKSLQMQVGK
jgi:cyclic lactone autoinducer peptide